MALPPLPLLAWRLRQWVQWRARAHRLHGLHSPYVYQLASQVLAPKNQDWPGQVEALRLQLAASAQPLNLLDYGAGWHADGRSARQTTVGAVARSSARGYASGALLYRLVQHFQPKTVLELGTNLGIGSLYLAGGMPAGSTLHTLEGDPGLAKLAANHLAQYAPEVQANISIGPFEETLPQLLGSLTTKIDVVVLDGHHTSKAVRWQLAQLMLHLSSQAVVVVDDIYWTPDMLLGWQQAIALPRVSAALNLFHTGILLLDRDMARQQFWLRY